MAMNITFLEAHFDDFASLQGCAEAQMLTSGASKVGSLV
jgi:hypothetical protein